MNKQRNWRIEYLYSDRPIYCNNKTEVIKFLTMQINEFNRNSNDYKVFYKENEYIINVIISLKRK